MQREIIKWIQSLELSSPVQNPKRDLATGHAAAEIVSHYSGTRFLDVQRLPSGASPATKRDVWQQVYAALQRLQCQTVTPALIDAVLRREPNAALTVLECLYEHFTGRTLPMHGLDAVGTSRNAYVQPANAASTAKLLAVTSGAASDVKSAASAVLYDPLSASAPAAADATSSQRVRTGTDSTVDGGDAPSMQALQHRLALIDNDELAGGANALQSRPRYARPTASTLVHTASGSRKDVVLDRPKYTADEVRQQAQNTRITQQHAVVRRLQAEEGRQAGGRDGLSSSWPAATVTETSSGRGSGTMHGELPLTTVYRGRFFREPDAGTKGAKATKGKRSERLSFAAGADGGIPDDVSGGGAAGAAGSEAEDRPFSANPHLLHHSGGRAVPKMRVTVHSTALKTALALRSGPAQLQERAAAMSRELFAKHGYRLRPALSEVLADVLGAHKQLEHLLDCCSDDGSGEVLENVLGHVVAHRHAFPLPCVQACWEALNQHVAGVAAALQHSPDEYAYVLESCAFAFSAEAAQLPVVQAAAGPGAVATTAIDGYAGVADMPMPVVKHEDGPPEARFGGRGAERASVASSSLNSSANGAGATATQRPSAAEAVPLPEEDGQTLPPAARPAALYVNVRQSLDVAAVLSFLRDVARQLDVPTAVYVLERYLLRAARPFLLRRGSAAVREAVAQIVSASFLPAASVSQDAAASATTSTAAAPEAESSFLTFVTGSLAACVGAARRPINAAAQAPPSVRCERAYWHLFSHAVADFTAAERSNQAGGGGGGGPAGVMLPSPPAAGSAALSSCLYESASLCLDSADAELRMIGVALAQECCGRWLLHLKHTEDGLPDSADGLSRAAVRVLATRVLLGEGPEMHVHAAEAVGGTLDLSGVWWNTPALATWELRLAVLRLTASLIALGPRTPREDSVDGGVLQHVADIAAVCLATFASTASSGDEHDASAGGPSWQLHLALLTTAGVVDPARTPALTACWAGLVARLPPARFGRSVVLGDDGVAVPLLLARLQALGHASAFMPPPTALAQQQQQQGPAWQQAESALSGSRRSRGYGDSRVVSAGGAAHNGVVGGGGSTPGSARAQRAATHPTTATAAGESMLSLPYAVEESLLAQHLVCGRLRSAYTLQPLYQAWNTRGVLDTLLLSHGPSSGATAADTALLSSAIPPSLQLSVLVGALASPSTAADASTFHSELDADPISAAVVRRVWPLMQARGFVSDAMPELGARPPPRVTAQQVEEGEVNALAVVAVALFLRCASDAAVASGVAAASGEDWRLLCLSAVRWAEALCQPQDSA